MQNYGDMTRLDKPICPQKESARGNRWEPRHTYANFGGSHFNARIERIKRTNENDCMFLFYFAPKQPRRQSSAHKIYVRGNAEKHLALEGARMQNVCASSMNDECGLAKEKTCVHCGVDERLRVQRVWGDTRRGCTCLKCIIGEIFKEDFFSIGVCLDGQIRDDTSTIKLSLQSPNGLGIN